MFDYIYIYLLYHRPIKKPFRYDLGALEMILARTGRNAHSVFGRARRGEQVARFTRELTLGSHDVGRNVAQIGGGKGSNEFSLYL